MLPSDLQEKEKDKDKDKEETIKAPNTHKINKSVNLKNMNNAYDVFGNRANSQEKDKKDRSLSKSTKLRKKLYPDEKKLFSTTDLKKLSKLLSNTELEKYQKKFDYADHKGLSMEKKYNSEFKIYHKKYNDLEEQMEFITLQLKEAEQRAKIFQFQIHEYKLEMKNLTKKSHELQGNIEVLQKLVNEKEKENKALINRIQETQSLNEIYKKKNGEMTIRLKEFEGVATDENGAFENDDEVEGTEYVKPQKNKGLDD